MPETTAQLKDTVLIVQLERNHILDPAVIRETREELMAHLQDCEGKLLIDCKKVTFMASGMIGSFTLLKQRANAAEVKMKICCLAPSIREIFRIIRLDKVFSIHDSQEDALKSFESWGCFE